jgi:hypothetical protein
VRASDWRAHGHDGDPRYDRVSLHVVWRDDLGVSVLEGVPTLALATVDEALLFERLRQPCRAEEPYHEWLREMPAAERAALLDRLGDDRLHARALRIGADLHALGPAEALHRALLDALGYSQNRPAFRTLAELVPAARLGPLARDALRTAKVVDAEEIVTAHLLALAGLLDDGPIGRLGDAAGREVAQRYRAIVGTPPGDRLAPGAWELVGVRPANRPQRRLAALAALAVRTSVVGLDEALLETLALPEPRAALRALHGLLRVGPDEGYWSWHHDFGRRLPGAPMACLGDARVGAVVANVAIPWALALADATGDGALEDAARAVWAIAPGGGPNWITAEMRPLFAGVSLASARREQGAIELFRRCCEERRCLTCPTGGSPGVVASR